MNVGERTTASQTALRIVATADWHEELPADLPDGDVLVIAGDVLPDFSDRFPWLTKRFALARDIYQAWWLLNEFVPYLDRLPYGAIVLIGGNHDRLFERDPSFARKLPGHVHYLCDSGVELDGVRFWGTPWAPTFGDWSFMGSDENLAARWARIPAETDVLVVHGPPFGVCDFSERARRSVGSKTLRERIVTLRIPLVLTGHIHEGAGADMIGLGTTVANVSMKNERFETVHTAYVFDVERHRELAAA